MIQQDKLQECSYDSANDEYDKVPGSSWNLAGSGVWSDFETEEVSSTTTGYHTTFTASHQDKKFTLSAHVSVTEYDVEEPIPCQNCTWCSSAKRENLSLILHLLVALTCVTHNTRTVSFSHIIHTLTHNNATRILRNT